ncbi:YggN family protein [uncultured Vibrio sp.]|uniref:YggN family protein n=1 Tax=uncultured Vibrio sp. TaxID=114054 RepID=UPI000919AE68|nr:YggN family protein [uncultured Vibrio sp.]OIQ25762.1 MAG: chemotaxis protein [Vibrio sp. MedPE-SWchi]
MKKYVLFLSLTVSHMAAAGQCQVNLKNEIHLNTNQLEVVQVSGDSAVVDSDNDLYISGEKVELNAEQKNALKQYREDINQYLPQAKKIASDSLALANDIVDDIAESLEAPEAFEDVKASMKAFLADLEARYYKEGDLVVPADSFDSMTQSWSEDFEKAKELFNKEFIASAFDAMSEKMQKEGGLNLTELADSLAELKAKVEQRLEEHDLNVEKQTEEFCESLDGMAEQEEQLHQKIPALKDYQLFTI